MTLLVTVQEAKEFLKITDEDVARDSALEMIIEGLGAHIEIFTGRLFSVTAIIDKIDGGVDNLQLTKYPVVAVSEVKDLVNDQVLTAGTHYEVDLTAGLVYPAGMLTDPFSSLRFGGTPFVPGRQRWQVTYTAGSDGAPNDVKLALLQWLQSVEETKSGLSSEKIGDYAYTVDSKTVETGAPPETRRLLEQHRGGKIHL